MRMSRARLAALGAVIVVVAGAACSAVPNLSAPTPPSQSGKAAQPPAPAAVPAAAPAGALAGGPAVADAAAQRSAAPAAAAPNSTAANEAGAAAQAFDRMVIRTAQLTVEVTDIEQGLAQARAIASRSGGFVSASNTRIERVNDQDRTVADLTIQVRSDAADAALSDLRALGKVTTEASGSQDVTEEYTDLDSNLRNLQASESAILKLMDKATRIEDVLALQRELTNIRGQIERIQGRKRYLERRSDMATITLALRLPPAEAPRPGGAWDPVAVAQRGWQASLTILRGMAELLIIAAAFSWWLLPFVALGGYVLLQRRRAAAPAPPAATTTSAAP
jgi:hypothetical protein